MFLSRENSNNKHTKPSIFIPVMSYLLLFYVYVLTSVIVLLSTQGTLDVANMISVGGKYFRRKSTQNRKKK